MDSLSVKESGMTLIVLRFSILSSGSLPIPPDSFTASFSLTNRTMNLDKHYPTYYLVDGVIGEVALRWDGGF
jgi:hypothetical protein